MAEEQALLPKASYHLGHVVLWGYSLGEMGGALITQIISFYSMVFLLDVAQLNPFHVSFVMGAAKLWDTPQDAVSDPVVGYLSDRTKSKWGKRRLWILMSSLPGAAAYFAFWLVPSISWKPVYYGIILVLQSTTFTCVFIPYTAMTPELSPDYDERTRITRARMVLYLLGGLGATFAHSIIIETFVSDGRIDYQRGYFWACLLWSVLFFLTQMIVVLVTTPSFVKKTRKEIIQPPPAMEEIDTRKDESEPEEEEEEEVPLLEGNAGFWKGMVQALANRSLVILTVVYALSWFTANLVVANLYMFLEYVTEKESIFRWVLLCVEGCATVLIFVLEWLSHRVGKRYAFIFGSIPFMISMMCMFFIGPSTSLVMIFVIALLAGFGIASTLLLPWSMLSDVVELDELRTGKRRSGFLFSFFIFVQKATLALGLSMSSYVLGAAGYVTPPEPEPVDFKQPPSVRTALRWITCMVPFCGFLCACIAVLFFPITRSSHAVIRAKLAKRKEKK